MKQYIIKKGECLGAFIWYNDNKFTSEDYIHLIQERGVVTALLRDIWVENDVMDIILDEIENRMKATLKRGSGLKYIEGYLYDVEEYFESVHNCPYEEKHQYPEGEKHFDEILKRFYKALGEDVELI